MRARLVTVTLGVAVSCVLGAAGCGGSGDSRRANPRPAAGCVSHLDKPNTYIGVYAQGFPPDTAALAQFQNLTGVRPNLITFYPRFGDGFDPNSICIAIQRGAIPVIQIDPVNIALQRIADGQSDAYLRYLADAVKTFGAPVVISFGHEMNGSWYSWGYGHTTPAVFVATWRHIVNVFRSLQVHNVTWLWTVNVINDTAHGRIPNPAPWWPGASYVNWVGIDGYYFKPSWTFASLFGPTITAVREVTGDPIIIAETGVAAGADQPAKIADLFSGVRTYRLLGLIWFDALGSEDWRIATPAAAAAFHKASISDKRSAK